jgi:hypothetical protein
MLEEAGDEGRRPPTVSISVRRTGMAHRWLLRRSGFASCVAGVSDAEPALVWLNSRS